MALACRTLLSSEYFASILYQLALGYWQSILVVVVTRRIERHREKWPIQ